MAMDTPAKIAILGAGPIGLETALYARFLGFEVELFEQGEAANSVKRWGHVRMFSDFEMNRSSLALAALYAQDESFEPPRDDELLTGNEWVERFLLPLSRTDLVADHIRTNTRVTRVGRTHWLKPEAPGDVERGEDGFQILYQSKDGTEGRSQADIVIDCSGVFREPNWLGPGGTPALGETTLRDDIEYGVPDVLGADRDCYAGKRTLVVGSGYSAATTISALAELLGQTPDEQGELLWLRRPSRFSTSPIALIENDRLTSRDQLGRKANELAESGAITGIAGIVKQVSKVDGRIRVDIQVPNESSETDAEHPAHSVRCEVVDRVVANVGYRGDWSLCEDLQVHRCYATDGPIKLAAELMANSSGDCLDQSKSRAETLVCPEPNFYILGAKSYGRSSKFLFAQGLEQIRDLFSLIGQRSTLDLYAGAKTLPS